MEYEYKVHDLKQMLRDVRHERDQWLQYTQVLCGVATIGLVAGVGWGYRARTPPKFFLLVGNLPHGLRAFLGTKMLQDALTIQTLREQNLRLGPALRQSDEV